MQYSLSDRMFIAGRQTGKNFANFKEALTTLSRSMFDAHAEIAYMDIWPSLQEFNRRVYMPIDDCPVSDMTEFRKCEITHGNGCIITNQGNIMVYSGSAVTHRLVRCVIPKAIEFYLNGHLLRYIGDSDRTTLGYFNRFKF